MTFRDRLAEAIRARDEAEQVADRLALEHRKVMAMLTESQRREQQLQDVLLGNLEAFNLARVYAFSRENRDAMVALQDKVIKRLTAELAIKGALLSWRGCDDVCEVYRRVKKRK